jgi:quinolinate synthase
MTTTIIFDHSTSQLALNFDPFRNFSDSEIDERILTVKQRMGDSLLILGHHYQQDEVIRFADLRGDSYRLTQLAAKSASCRAIVFCGVHFMAETADILSHPEVDVDLPDLAAGCSTADMPDRDAVEAAWEGLTDVIDTEQVTPVTYINSSAQLKAFCGRKNGIVCTSSNEQAPSGSTWGIGTELHLVNRLAHEHPDKSIHFLSPFVCMCATMFRIDLPHLAWCLDNLDRGAPVDGIKVPHETTRWAKVALERMLEVRESSQ